MTRLRRYRVRRVSFSRFACPDSFSTVPSASCPVFTFCVPVLVFFGTEGVLSRFQVLRSRTRFRRCRGPRVPFLYFALPNSFSTTPGASGLVFLFCPPGFVFGGTVGVGSRFLVLRSQTRFRQHRGRRVLFSYFAHPDSFSAVSRASCPVFMFCAPGLVFDDNEGVGSRFQVLRARTRFRRYRGCRVPFSRLELRDSFSAVPSASDPVFMFCVPGFVFGGTYGVGSRFHVFRARSCFLRYRWCRVSFSCFALLDSFSAVPRASGPVFMFCALGLIFGVAVCVGSRFHVLRALTHFWRYRGRRVPFSCFARPDSCSTVPIASRPIFTFCAPGLIFGGTEGIGSCFHVLRSLTRFRRYGGRRVPFSHFACPFTFSVVSRASGPVFKFCALGLIFGGDRVCRVPFSRFACPFSFSVVPMASGPFSSFARSDSFSAVPRASGPIFTFCAAGLIFGGVECVGSRLHVLRSRTYFRRYRGCRVPFFIICAPDVVFGGTEGVGSRFQVLRARTRFRRYRGCRVPFSRLEL
jgi:hypothetical protein